MKNSSSKNVKHPVHQNKDHEKKSKEKHLNQKKKNTKLFKIKPITSGALIFFF
jgi:hypothetical protein